MSTLRVRRVATLRRGLRGVAVFVVRQSLDRALGLYSVPAAIFGGSQWSFGRKKIRALRTLSTLRTLGTLSPLHTLSTVPNRVAY